MTSSTASCFTITLHPRRNRVTPQICKYKKTRQNLKSCLVIILSLLSDSNQRPRDYKSRALAN